MLTNKFFFTVLFSFICFAGTLYAQVKLTPEGIRLPLQGLDDIVFEYPQLQDNSTKDLVKIFDKVITNNGQHAAVKYEGGTELVFDRKDNGIVELRIKNPPENFSKLRFGCLIPFAVNEGGTFSVDGGDAKPFPMEKPEKPHLYQGNASEILITAPSGATLKIGGFEVGNYFQVQDNREWNWSIYYLAVFCPYNKDHEIIELRFNSGKDEKHKTEKMVDKFGQDFSRTFPGKITSEDELKNDVETDKQYYASLPKQTGLDGFGGFDGTGKKLGLKKTGFFHTQNVNGKWYLADPDGNAFFHLALCSFQPGEDYTYTQGRESIFEWLPPRSGEFATAWNPQQWWNDKAVSFYLANVIRKYGKPYEVNEWAARMVDRVRKFGFTSGGCFSGIPQAFTDKNFPHVRSFGFWGLGFDLPGARGFYDVFNLDWAKKIDENFARDITPHADEPLLIGYYLANEQAAEDLPRAIPALDGKFETKRELVKFLKQKYSSIEKFNAAWEMKAESFDSLINSGLPVSTKAASEDITAFTGIYLDKYYSVLAGLFRKYDKNHLLLGSRWQPGTANNETLVKVCAEYCDVISVNYYTVAFDKKFLDRIEKWSGGKPMLLSEWHYTCTAESALPGGLGPVSTQKERGMAYRNYVEQAAATGYVVGIEWFTLLDQARSGRFFELNTGEKANTGFFSVADRPWKDFAAEVIKTNLDILPVLEGKREPFVFDDPRFVPKSNAGKQTVSAYWVDKNLKIDGSRDDWGGQPPVRISEDRLVMGTDSAGVSAAFRVSWNKDYLYIFADVADKTPAKNSVKGQDLWQGDGIEVFTGSEDLDKAGSMIFSDRQVLLGAGSGEGQTFVRNAASQRAGGTTPVPERSVLLKPDGTGYYIEAAIPFVLLGIEPKEGQELLFDIAVDDSEDGMNRQRQFVWNGDNRVSGERGCWGRLRLVK